MFGGGLEEDQEGKRMHVEDRMLWAAEGDRGHGSGRERREIMSV